MQKVSDFWKSIHRQQLVNETFVEISFDITDPDAITDASSEDNGAIYIANTAQITSEVDKTIVPYGTLEENLWLLDGSRRFIPESEFGDNGYIGDILSRSDCGFDKIPVINIKFSKVHEPLIPGVTITWGTAYGECAEVFKVTAYNDSTVVAEHRVEGNTSLTSAVEMDIANYDRIKIEILKWCLPYHRPRVAEIFVGINKIYTKSDITGYEHEQEVSPIGATTPINKIGFALDNSDSKYDPNNESGLSKYIMERQELKVRYGMKLNSGEVEYIPGGVFYLSEWEAPQNGLEASFTARDLLEFMRKTYTRGLYRPNGINLYDLAVDVLNEANLPLNGDGSVKWVIDDKLKTVYTTAPLPLAPLSECLQYIAQAACCVVYCDRLGVLHIEPISTEVTDYELTSFNMFSRPEISLQKPLRSVNTKVYNHFVGETGKELFTGSVAVDGTKVILVTYSAPAINATASVTNGTLVSAEYYSNACMLTLKGNGTVSVRVVGDALSSSAAEYVLDAQANGEVQSVENPLITSTAHAADVSEWVRAWLGDRKIISMGGWRADPRLDATDIVVSENKFTRENVRMTSVKYTYAGAFKGTGEGRVK